MLASAITRDGQAGGRLPGLQCLRRVLIPVSVSKAQDLSVALPACSIAAMLGRATRMCSSEEASSGFQCNVCRVCSSAQVWCAWARGDRHTGWPGEFGNWKSEQEPFKSFLRTAVSGSLPLQLQPCRLTNRTLWRLAQEPAAHHTARTQHVCVLGMLRVRASSAFRVC